MWFFKDPSSHQSRESSKDSHNESGNKSNSIRESESDLGKLIIFI